MKSPFALFTTALLLVNANADTNVLTEENASGLEKKSNSSVGVDFRARHESYDNIPVAFDPPGVARNGYNNYFDLRTRVFGTLELCDDALFNIRFLNYFRLYNNGNKTFKFPDELVVDKLNFQINEFFGDSNYLVIGRQEIRNFGSKRIFFEGTAKDGSRTIYFDGVTGHFSLAEKTTLDLFATYTTAENKLAIGNEDRDITGYGSGFNDMDEASAGFFLTHKIPDVMDITGYYVWKHDTSWRKADATLMPGEDIHTMGAFLQPKFSKTLSSEIEYAYQMSPSSDSDRCAMLGFAGLKYSPQISNNPYVSANFLYLSGDDPDSSRREDWNPVFGRYPWIRELVIFSYDPEGAGCWNNLLYGYLEFGCSLFETHKFKGTVGVMGAEENNGSGEGHIRGEVITGQYDFPIPLLDKLAGCVIAEVLFPDDYYTNEATSYFLRLELTCVF